jgi:hypothetical protein
MTKYGSASALWPDRAGKPRSRVSKSAMVCIGVAAVAVLVAVHSFDQLIASSGEEVTTKPASTAESCWRDWPYVEASCRGGVTKRQASRSARRTEPETGGDRSITTASVPEVPATNQTTGSGRNNVAPAQGGALAVGKAPAAAAPVPAAAPAPEPAVPAAPVAAAPAPVVAAPAPAAPAPAAPATSPAKPVVARPAVNPPAPVAAAQPSERELTFKQGYIQRQAALGHPVEGKPAAAAKPAKDKAAHAKPRKERAPSQVVELPDGRKVVVRRQSPSGGYDAARLEPPSGRFRAADNRARGFGEPFGGERRGGWFW